MDVKKLMVYGLIIGLGMSFISILFYLLDEVVSLKVMAISWLAIVGLKAYFIMKYKETAKEGYMKYSEVLLATIVLSIFAGIIINSFNLIHMNLNVAYVDMMIDQSMELTMKFAEMGGGIPDSEIANIEKGVISGIEEQGVGSIVKGIFGNALAGGFLGLIFGLIFKKEKPFFDNEEIID